MSAMGGNRPFGLAPEIAVETRVFLEPVQKASWHRPLEMSPCVEHASLHRVDRAIDDLSDLAIAKPVKVGEVDNGAMVCRQLVHRLHERTAQAIVVKPVVGKRI